MAARQMTLDLALRPALSRDDFLVSPANAAAVALVDQWPNWPTYGAIIVGPAGSGKSHLATVWQQVSGASLVAAKDVRVEQVADLLAQHALVIEDVDAGEVNANALFHALNLARQEGGHVLLTASQRPQAWNLSLKDLNSRLSALPVTAIEPPDDALLRGVLVKLFADRQIAVDEALVSFLMARMPRSLDMARRLVQQLDAQALALGVPVTRAFASKVLASMLGEDEG